MAERAMTRRTFVNTATAAVGALGLGAGSAKAPLDVRYGLNLLVYTATFSKDQVDLIKKVGSSGNYLSEEHTVRRFRQEHFIPNLLPREPYEAWEKAGERTALDHAKERVRQIVIVFPDHPAVMPPSLKKPLDNLQLAPVMQILFANTDFVNCYIVGKLLTNQTLPRPARQHINNKPLSTCVFLQNILMCLRPAPAYRWKLKIYHQYLHRLSFQQI